MGAGAAVGGGNVRLLVTRTTAWTWSSQSHLQLHAWKSEAPQRRHVRQADRLLADRLGDRACPCQSCPDDKSSKRPMGAAGDGAQLGRGVAVAVEGQCAQLLEILPALTVALRSAEFVL